MAEAKTMMRRRPYIAPLVFACVFLVLRIINVALNLPQGAPSARSIIVPVIVSVLLILGAAIPNLLGRFFSAAGFSVLVIQDIVSYSSNIANGSTDRVFMTIYLLEIISLIVIALAFFIGGRVMSILKLIFSIIFLLFTAFWPVYYLLIADIPYGLEMFLFMTLSSAMLGLYGLLRPCVRLR